MQSSSDSHKTHKYHAYIYSTTVLFFCTAPLSLADQPEAELFPMDIDHA